jgi:hypothetical protein
MSDEFDHLTASEALPPELSHRRILILMAALITAGSVAGFVFASAGFGIGVLVGGIMSFANYFWQRNSTRAIFEQAVKGETPVFLAVRYILRYVIFGIVLWFFYITGAFPIVAVVLGLAAFAFAVVVEGLIGIFTSSNRKES